MSQETGCIVEVCCMYLSRGFMTMSNRRLMLKWTHATHQLKWNRSEDFFWFRKYIFATSPEIICLHIHISTETMVIGSSWTCDRACFLKLNCCFVQIRKQWLISAKDIYFNQSLTSCCLSLLANRHIGLIPETAPFDDILGNQNLMSMVHLLYIISMVIGNLS